MKIRKTDSKVHIKITRIIRKIMRKSTKRKLSIPDSKAYFKATIIKSVVSDHELIVHWNSLKSPEID